ncbi:UNVERIFIED_CONTAM: twitching motility protein PilT [Euhalothece sp. KZN 001]
MKILFDTSVLVAALLVDHPNHNRAFSQLELAKRGKVQGYLSTHTLAELYAVMTRLPQPLRVLPNQAQEVITDLLAYLIPVSLSPEEYQSAIARMVKFRLSGGGMFDCIIAEAALKVTADCLLTFNPKDFIRLGEDIESLVQVPN